MLNRARACLGAAAAVVLTAAASGAAVADAPTATIDVPDDFVAALSDTRATGHYELTEDGGLRVWTEGTTSTDKVAEYVATQTPLSAAGEPALDYAPTSGSTPPGFQLVVDFDGDGSPDGILVGEPTFYGSDWWLGNAAAAFVKSGAPVTGGGSGSTWHGTLDQWRAAFPDADVLAFGFSLGSGVKGDGVIQSITFAGTTYAFGVVVGSAAECKGGGWATSTAPTFRNQGDCVSAFARSR
ncbi:hypothetical protein [Nocardioides perillae]|uniref:Uncharacterized protein n=1 Tax=Nocardioides perillae TaxID=1119534 RepID=A0A7Y9UKZ3_9ACTN|nr:hypothetical protein [Nocardioides perillae]NYG54492.1 hypothetical protein [Nocardioides perillae]